MPWPTTCPARDVPAARGMSEVRCLLAKRNQGNNIFFCFRESDSQGHFLVGGGIGGVKDAQGIAVVQGALQLPGKLVQVVLHEGVSIVRIYYKRDEKLVCDTGGVYDKVAGDFQRG